MIADLVVKTRSFRRFDESKPIEPKVLEDLVNLGRLSASGGNLQPLKYIVTSDTETNAKVFPCLRWAGYLVDWDGPGEGERPAGYITILRDNEVTINTIIDHGIAAQSMRLGATERGLGSCIMGSIDRDRLRSELEIPARYEILVVLVLGVPAEKVVLEAVEGGNVRYWRDDKGVLHVPKRSLQDVVLA
jgi:nitroreductase